MSYDLTFVAPERRDEVRRRIAAIERFLSSPSRTAAADIANELGLRTAQFYNLVRTWKAHRRPERLAGAGRRKERDLGVTASQAKMMNNVMAEDPRAAPSEMVHSIMARLETMPGRAPRQEIITRYVARTRPALLPNSLRNSGDLIIDHTVLELPVRTDAGLTRPLATMLIDAGRESIVGIALSTGHPDAGCAAAAMLDAVRRCTRHASGNPISTLSIVRPGDADNRWAAFDQAVDDAGFEQRISPITPRAGGKAIEALLGRKPAGIMLRPRLTRSPLEKRKPKGGEDRMPMILNDAENYVRPLLIGHDHTALFAHLDDISRARLTTALADLAAR